MLELTLKSPKRFLNDIVTLRAPDNTRRALADRRAATPGVQSGAPRKRRRHDSLHSARPALLEW